MTGFSAEAPTQSGRSVSPPASAWTQSDFKDKCLEILRRTIRSLKQAHVWFDHPVEAHLAPDYYDIVKQPMDLGTVERKLKKGQYSAPQEFLAVKPAA